MLTTGSRSGLTWRPLAPVQGHEYKLLLDQAFGLTAPQSYLADFPVWDPVITPAQYRYQIGGHLDDRLACTASIRMVNYKFRDGTSSRFGLIGAVATLPEFSGQGYATEAIDLLIQEGERRSVNIFALWGSESAIYKKHSFQFGGKQIRVPLRTLTFPKSAIKGFDFRVGWDTAIAEHLLARKEGVQYEDSDVLWLSRHRNTEWRTLWLDGKCLAYCAWNRGIDLPNMIHELGGDPAAAMVLLGLLQVRYPDLEWITHPMSLIRYGVKGGELHHIESLAQFRSKTFSAEKLDEIWFSGMDSC